MSPIGMFKTFYLDVIPSDFLIYSYEAFRFRLGRRRVIMPYPVTGKPYAMLSRHSYLSAAARRATHLGYIRFIVRQIRNLQRCIPVDQPDGPRSPTSSGIPLAYGFIHVHAIAFRQAHFLQSFSLAMHLLMGFVIPVSIIGES